MMIFVLEKVICDKEGGKEIFDEVEESEIAEVRGALENEEFIITGKEIVHLVEKENEVVGLEIKEGKMFEKIPVWKYD